MDHPIRASRFRPEAFLSTLKRILETLPSEVEKHEIDANVATLIGFLTDLRTRFRSIPTTDDTREALEAIQNLEGVLARVRASPVLASAFGLGSRAATRPRRSVGLSQTSVEQGKAALTQLEKLSEEEIHTRLLDEREYSANQLKAVAAALGIRTAKVSRESLAHQITTRIANYRGYQTLSGRTDEDAQGV